MGNRMLFPVATAAAVALATAPATAAPVSATPDSDGRALVLIPLTLTKVQDLDFGTVVTSPAAGTVTIDPATGARTLVGGVTAVASDPGQRAIFAGAGTANQVVDLSLSSVPGDLDDGLGNLIPVSLVLELTQTTVDPTSKAFSVGVGGTINVGADQPDGVYNGAFTVTANYQ